MCDEGRLGYHHVNDPARLRQYMVRGENGTRAVEWSEAAGVCREKLGAAASRDPGRVWIAFSPSMTVEEAWLLANYARQLSPFVKLAMGPVTVSGADDTYPKDRKGRPEAKVKFTIRAEKASNARGVRGVLAHFQKDRLDYQNFLQAARGGQVDACLISQGQSPAIYKPGVEEGDALASVGFVAVQEMFASSLTDRAHVVIPASAFSEVDGTLVNHAGLAQAKRASCAPWRGTRTDGQFYLELLERKGLVHAGNLRKEIAKVIPAFKPLESGDLGEYGVYCEKLKDPA
jgi:NADH-quinone oxidoreductase subunit G